MSPVVFLGDLVRAFAVLQPVDEDAKRAVAATLGFDWGGPPPPPPPDPPTPPPESATWTPSAPVDHTTGGHAAVSPPPAPAPERRTVVPSTLEAVAGPTEPPPFEVEPLPPDTAEAALPALEPLFVPRWTRAILAAALSTPVEEGPVDVDRLVEALARRQAVSRLPRLLLPTVRHGVQLLLDRSPAMTPFLRDQRWLEERIRRVVGVERVEARRFSACPLRGSGRGPVTDWERPYRPPPAGTPVVLLTDLGIGRPPGWDEWAGVDEWLRFADQVRRARCRPIAFVPYQPRRWPARLVRAMTVIQWDRTTTVASARQRARAGRWDRPMSPPTGRAALLLKQLSGEAPGAVRLARVVSLAARIEPELLRRARLWLLPGVDAGAEADLWFGPLATDQTSLAMSLDPGAAELLRSQLAAEPALLDAAWSVLQEVHTHAPPAVVLQEQVTYLALKGAIDRMRELLLSAVTAMVVQDRRGMARWAVRAVPRLPLAAVQTQEAQMLIAGAQARLGLAPEVAEDAGEWLHWVLPDQIPRTAVGVRMVDGGLEVGDPALDGSHRIELPRTTPMLVELSWRERFRHGDGAVHAVAFSPDGRHLLTGGDDGTACLWDLTAGREVHRLAAQGPVVSAVFSPDGRRVVTAVGGVAVWDVATGTLVRSLERYEGIVRKVAFHPDGRLLVTAEDGGVWLRDLAAAGNRRPLGAPDERSVLETMAVDPSGRRVATGGRDGTLRVLDLEGAELLRLAQSAPILALAFSPDGRWIATGGDHGVLRLDARSGAAVGTFREPGVRALAISPDSRLLVVGTRAGLWIAQVSDWAVKAGPEGLDDFGEISTVGISPDGGLAAVGGERGVVGLVNLERGAEVLPYRSADVRLSQPAASQFVPLRASEVHIRTALGESYRIRTAAPQAPDVAPKGILRVLVTVDPDWTVTISPQAGGGWRYDRAMRRFSLRGGFFPYPAEVVAEAQGGPDREAEDLWELALDIEARRVTNVDAQRLGRHLFDSLLGAEAWERIVETARRLDARGIDLALRWPLIDQDLGRLPWEIMRNQAGFLLQGVAGLEVTITRMLPGSAGLARPTGSPVRLLVVAGGSLSDTALRPGARYVGLLQHLQTGQGEFHTRVLEHTSPERLQAAVAGFQPDVVHLILRGDRDPDGRWLVDIPDPEGEATRRSSEELLSLLQADGHLPGILLLSICRPGPLPAPAGAAELAPFAGGLVAGGVPLVAVLGGPLSDRASRIFATAVGTAILEGQPIVQATGRVPWVAFEDGPEPGRVDWGRSGVFVAESVPVDHAMTPASDRTAQLENWITDYGLRQEPVFSGRVAHLEVFLDMLDGTDRGSTTPRVLLVHASGQGLGRTRLLSEMAIRALRQGHLPLLLTFTANDDPPKSMEAFANDMARAISVAHRVLELEEAPTYQLDLVVLAADPRDEPEGIDRTIWAELRRTRTLTPRVLNLAIQRDLASLLEAAKAKYTYFGDSAAQVVVLLDDIDEYGPLTELLLADPGGIITASGFGKPENPVPVVMTFSLGSAKGGSANDRLREIAEGRTPPWLVAKQLGPFERNDEDLLAYETVLLHPFAPNLYEQVSDVPWAFNDEIADEVREEWEEMFRNVMRGIPARFWTDTFYVLAEAASSESVKFTIRADDDVWLSRVARAPR
jgi:hypothetical protein